MPQRSKIDDATFLRMAAEFLNRINADPRFAKAFDKDPAGALQGIFPQLAEVPKKQIASALDAHMKQMSAVLAPATQPSAALVAGLLSLLSRVASRLTRTTAIRSSAKFLVTAVASEMVCRLFSVQQVEPIPE